jgi:glucokinase
VPDEPIYIGLDVGGTKFLVASAGADGRILARAQEPTPPGVADGLALLERMAERVAGGRKIAAIGAAVGGPLDWQSGVVSPLHQPQWRGVPLAEHMRRRWGCPFRVDVDTNLAALGEYRFGGARASRLLYLTVSTGMGGGFLIDGRIYRGPGPAGVHPEVSHQSVPFRVAHPERVACECGASDCLEALVSGNAIRRIYGKPAEQLTDDEWAEVGYNLGQGMRNFAAILAPELIVLGGGVALGGGEKLLAPARAVLNDRLRIVPIPEVRLSRLGYDTALMGAIAAAIHGIE